MGKVRQEKYLQMRLSTKNNMNRRYPIYHSGDNSSLCISHRCSTLVLSSPSCKLLPSMLLSIAKPSAA